MNDSIPAETRQAKVYASQHDQVSHLKSLCRDWNTTDGFWEFDQVLETLHRRKGLLYYFEQDNKWIAAALFVCTTETADLCYLYVRPDERGKGLGTELLRSALLEIAKKGAIHEVLLEVKPENTYAIQMYQSIGFTPVTTRKLYYRDGTDALVMKCSIAIPK